MINEKHLLGIEAAKQLKTTLDNLSQYMISDHDGDLDAAHESALQALKTLCELQRDLNSRTA